MSYVPQRRMVSLGKVHAPKPVNLPSQKRENNGLDPNVPIVPRGSSGTSCWGSSNNSGVSDATGQADQPPGTGSLRTSSSAGQQQKQPSHHGGPGLHGPSPHAHPVEDHGGSSAAWGGAGLPDHRKNEGHRRGGDFPQLGQEGHPGGLGGGPVGHRPPDNHHHGMSGRVPSRHGPPPPYYDSHPDDQGGLYQRAQPGPGYGPPPPPPPPPGHAGDRGERPPHRASRSIPPNHSGYAHAPYRGEAPYSSQGSHGYPPHQNYGSPARGSDYSRRPHTGYRDGPADGHGRDRGGFGDGSGHGDHGRYGDRGGYQDGPGRWERDRRAGPGSGYGPFAPPRGQAHAGRTEDATPHTRERPAPILVDHGDHDWSKMAEESETTRLPTPHFNDMEPPLTQAVPSNQETSTTSETQKQRLEPQPPHHFQENTQPTQPPPMRGPPQILTRKSAPEVIAAAMKAGGETPASDSPPENPANEPADKSLHEEHPEPAQHAPAAPDSESMPTQKESVTVNPQTVTDEPTAPRVRVVKAEYRNPPQDARRRQHPGPPAARLDHAHHAGAAPDRRDPRGARPVRKDKDRSGRDVDNHPHERRHSQGEKRPMPGAVKAKHLHGSGTSQSEPSMAGGGVQVAHQPKATDSSTPAVEPKSTASLGSQQARPMPQVQGQPVPTSFPHEALMAQAQAQAHAQAMAQAQAQAHAQAQAQGQPAPNTHQQMQEHQHQHQQLQHQHHQQLQHQQQQQQLQQLRMAQQSHSQPEQAAAAADGQPNQQHQHQLQMAQHTRPQTGPAAGTVDGHQQQAPQAGQQMALNMSSAPLPHMPTSQQLSMMQQQFLQMQMAVQAQQGQGVQFPPGLQPMGLQMPIAGFPGIPMAGTAGPPAMSGPPSSLSMPPMLMHPMPMPMPMTLPPQMAGMQQQAGSMQPAKQQIPLPANPLPQSAPQAQQVVQPPPPPPPPPQQTPRSVQTPSDQQRPPQQSEKPTAESTNGRPDQDTGRRLPRDGHGGRGSMKKRGGVPGRGSGAAARQGGEPRLGSAKHSERLSSQQPEKPNSSGEAKAEPSKSKSSKSAEGQGSSQAARFAPGPKQVRGDRGPHPKASLKYPKAEAAASQEVSSSGKTTAPPSDDLAAGPSGRRENLSHRREGQPAGRGAARGGGRDAPPGLGRGGRGGRRGPPEGRGGGRAGPSAPGTPRDSTVSSKGNVTDRPNSGKPKLGTRDPARRQASGNGSVHSDGPRQGPKQPPGDSSGGNSEFSAGGRGGRGGGRRGGRSGRGSGRAGRGANISSSKPSSEPASSSATTQ